MLEKINFFIRIFYPNKILLIKTLKDDNYKPYGMTIDDYDLKKSLIIYFIKNQFDYYIIIKKENTKIIYCDYDKKS